MKYSVIAKRLGLSSDADKQAAIILNSLVDEGKITRLVELIKGKKIIVFGAGPSLVDGINYAKKKKLHHDHTFIAADGAVSALLEHEVLPDIVVTDLRGNGKEDRIEVDIDYRCQRMGRGSLVTHMGYDGIGMNKSDTTEF